ncbi:MAG: TerC family protein [Rhodothermaceae bacterium]|nr:TerC family protein [Rhodothermaceae bacterium]
MTWFNFDWASSPEAWIAFLTLTALELVLGIDNIVFISILANKLPAEQRNRARFIGLGLAMITRVLLLFSIAWIIRLENPLFPSLAEESGMLSFLGELSGRDLILILGGLFLIGKSTHEIHDKLEGHEAEMSVRKAPSFSSVIVQILLLDLVFSLDSVITAVGMVPPEWIMIMVLSVVIAIIFMMVFAIPLGNFVEKHPTVKMLALSFLLLIGTALIADGLHHHIPKGYIYSAMGFSVFVEMLNLRLKKKKANPVKLNQPYVEHND